jgi:ribonuclease Z
MHGDHVLGLPGLLLSLQMAGRGDPLALAGPPGLREWVASTLRAVHARLAYPLDFTEIRRAGLCYQREEYVVEAEPVDHRVPAFGFAFHELERPGKFNVEAAAALGVPEGPLYGKLQRGESIQLSNGETIRPEQVLGPSRRGRKVAYVTDTRPCRGAERLASNADLLIHEATFDADRPEEAATKGHSSLADAVNAANRSGSRRLALMHFSPRYESMAEFERQLKRLRPDALLAEDGMVIELDREGEILGLTYEKRRKPPRLPAE